MIIKSKYWLALKNIKKAPCPAAAETQEQFSLCENKLIYALSYYEASPSSSTHGKSICTLKYF